MKIILASHVSYNDSGFDNYGAAHSVYSFISRRYENTQFLKFCLEGKHQPKIVTGQDQSSKCPEISAAPLFIRYLSEIWFILKKIWRGSLIFIGVDPVNGTAGAIGRLFNKNSVFIYYTVDYAEKRFNNPVMNFIYHLLDRFCIMNSDYIWSASTRIADKRKEQGVLDEKSIFIPNSLDYDPKRFRNYDGNKRLILVAHLNTAIDYNLILDAVKIIRNKNYTITLNIIGYGPEETEMIKKIIISGLDDCVRFDHAKDHDEVLRIMAKSFIGLAIYTDINPWTKYGDSVKTREYIGCGIPVITNDIPSSSEDINKYEAGIVITEVSAAKLASAIIMCLDNRKYYMHLRNNARYLSKYRDKSKILALELEKLFKRN
jgi:glycosyltransferase involved in cell wall biosynthesis